MQAHSVATIIKSVGLDERAWIVLATRVGFSEKLTLQELATELGLTRERVRQIQSKSSAKLKFRIRTIAPILDALEPYAKQLWNPFEVGDIREAFTAVENALKKEGWEVQDGGDIGRLLISLRALVHDGAKGHLSRWPTLTFAVCTLSPPIKRHPEVEKAFRARELEQWNRERTWTYEELAVAVLKQAMQPLHWREIADRSEALGRRRSFSAGVLFNALGTSDKLVRVDTGTYGLAEGGLTPVEAYDDIVAAIFHHAGRSLSFGYINSAVSRRREVKPGSLQMLLDLNPRFYRSIDGTYGLRFWLDPRDKQTLRTPSWKVEDSGSFARVKRALQRGYDVEGIVDEDRLISALRNEAEN